VRFNPFRPNNIATEGLFQGRDEEITLIVKSLFLTKNENPLHFLIEGERGLGKSSLFLKVHQIAAGHENHQNELRFKFLVLNIELNSSQGYIDVLKIIAAELKSAIAQKDLLKQKAHAVWEFLSNWEVLGVRYHKSESNLIQPYEVLNDIVQKIAEVIYLGGSEIDGVLILIDEADRPSENASLGEILKLISEKLIKKNCNKVAIGITGQPGLISKLKASHESAPRLFNIMSLKPLTPEESEAVIKNGLRKANEINKGKVHIEADALNLIIHLSDGYPHFLQEFAFMAFEFSSNGVITLDDVKKGAYEKTGALNQLGEKYFNDLYFSQISSNEYRKVLQAMANYSDGWVNRDMINQHIRIKSTTLNNAIQALKSRNIILANSKQSGEFRLPTKSFAAWIKAYSIAEENL